MTIATPGSLFDDAGEGLSVVAVLAQGNAGNREQRRFRQLVGQIELKREQLKQWQAYSLRYNQRVVAEVLPLRAQLRAGRREMVLLVDELLSEPTPHRRLKRRERAKLRDLLLHLAEGLLAESDDAAVEALHDKYSDLSREQARLSEMECTRALLNEALDLEIGADHGASSAEELLRRAQLELEKRASEEARPAGGGPRSRGAGKSKINAAKAAAMQAEREQAAREVSQSLREVFRKLASALHPDRELDEAARQRKTALMQRVNQAYEARDLLTLLGLQLEIEQIDAAHLSSVPSRRLMHYNEILREQAAELDAELTRLTEPFRQMLDFPGRTVTVAAVDRQLSVDVAQLRAALRELQADLVAFRDPDRLRDELKRLELEDDELDGDGEAEFTMLMEAALAERIHHAPPRGKSRRRR